MTEQWTWKPELGRWRLLEHGYPAAPVRVGISTDHAAGGDAYDYWRRLAFADFEPDPTPAEARRAFRARGGGLIWERADFYTTESAALSGGRDQRQIDRDGMQTVSIGVVLKGERRSSQAGDRQMVARAGELFVYDAAHPSRIEWSQHKAIFMVVRRPDAESVLGSLPAVSKLMHCLARSPLRHVLADQFRMLSRHLDFLSPNEQAYLLDQTIQLALFALAAPGDARLAEPAGQSMLMQAAMSYIELNLSDPMLDAAKIASAVGCSRATLYRIFASEGLGVAEAIRDIRLERARALIERLPPNHTINEIALACGIYDTANFARQFRRRFGVAPSDLRPAPR